MYLRCPSHAGDIQPGNRTCLIQARTHLGDLVRHQRLMHQTAMSVGTATRQHIPCIAGHPAEPQHQHCRCHAGQTPCDGAPRIFRLSPASCIEWNDNGLARLLRTLFGSDEYLIEMLFIERSEEHTSELQSLMRNSYAVFCLKKKKNNT